MVRTFAFNPSVQTQICFDQDEDRRNLKVACRRHCSAERQTSSGPLRAFHSFQQLSRQSSTPFDPSYSLNWSETNSGRMSKEKIQIPREEAVLAEPVFGGIETDVEKQLRHQERQQRQAYAADLQRQMQEQSQNRNRQNAFGREVFPNASNGVELENDLARQAKTAEREHQRKYQQDLQRQMEEKRQRNPANPSSFGEVPFLSSSSPRRSPSRADRQRYKSELDNQFVEQKLKRAQLEELYGGRPEQKRMEARRDLNSLKAAEEPPWFLGNNRQPKNGVRGSRGWQGQSPSPAPLQRQKSLPLDFTFGQPGPPGQIGSPLNMMGNNYGGNNYGGSSAFSPYSSMFQHQQQVDYKSQLQRQVQENQLQQQRQRLEQQRVQREPEVYDPWGKGGGGAPVRGKDGRVITDRRQMRRSWNGMVDSNVPHEFSPSNSMNAGSGATNQPPGFGTSNPTFGSGLDGLSSSSFGFGTTSAFNSNPMPLSQSFSGSPGKPLSEKDQNKLDLLAQIEEKKRLRELEKQKEREQEERDRQRIEKDLEKMRQEAEEEKKRQQKKLEEKQKKQEALAANQQQNQTTENPHRVNRPQRRQTTEQPAENDGLEWWEKGPTRPQRGASPAVPAARRNSNAARTQGALPRTPPPGAVYDSTQTLQREETPPPPPPPPAPRRGILDDEDLGTSTKDFKPSSAMQRNENVMRQLSAMRERLNKEQLRVKSALRRKEYGDELFSDEEFPTEFILKQEDDDDPNNDRPSLMHRSSKKSKPKQDPYQNLFSPGRSRKSSMSSSLGARRSKNPSATPTRRGRKTMMNGFLSDSDEEELKLAAGRRSTLSDYTDPNPDHVVNGFLAKRGIPPSRRSRRDSLGFLN